MSTQEPPEPQPGSGRDDAGADARRARAPPSATRHAAGAASAARGAGARVACRAAASIRWCARPIRCSTWWCRCACRRSRPTWRSCASGWRWRSRTFETEARAAGVDSEAIAAARYALCTLLDETIAGTAWGSGVWGTRSLLVAFHNEASGGEKVFLILQRLSQNAGANIDLLELIYLCLALGLEGRYRLIEQRPGTAGDAARTAAAADPPAARRATRPTCRRTGAAQRCRRASPLRRHAAVGAGGRRLRAAAGAATGGQRAAQPRLRSGVRRPVEDPRRRSRQRRWPRRLRPRRRAWPASWRRKWPQGLVSVRETAERSVVTLRGDGMFASGSAEVQDKFAPLLARIGDALQTLPGKVVVVGHTDDTRPGLSARFPSNYDLSKARAAGVMAALAAARRSARALQRGRPRRHRAAGGQRHAGATARATGASTSSC